MSKRKRQRRRSYPAYPGQPGIIQIRIDYLFGAIATIPACDNAKHFAAIAGTKGLTEKTLQLAEQLGFEIMNLSEQWEEPKADNYAGMNY